MEQSRSEAVLEDAFVLMHDKNVCVRFGDAGFAYARTLTWPGAIQKLLL